MCCISSKGFVWFLMFLQLQRPAARMISLVNEMEQRLPPALLRSYVVNGSTHGMHRSEELWTMEYRGTCGVAHCLSMSWWEYEYGFACLQYRTESGFMLHVSWEFSTAQTQVRVHFLERFTTNWIRERHPLPPGVKFRDWLGNLSNCWVPVTWIALFRRH